MTYSVSPGLSAEHALENVFTACRSDPPELESEPPGPTYKTRPSP
jgi:hypothetical protein